MVFSSTISEDSEPSVHCRRLRLCSQRREMHAFFLQSGWCMRSNETCEVQYCAVSSCAKRKKRVRGGGRERRGRRRSAARGKGGVGAGKKCGAPQPCANTCTSSTDTILGKTSEVCQSGTIARVSFSLELLCRGGDRDSTSYTWEANLIRKASQHTCKGHVLFRGGERKKKRDETRKSPGLVVRVVDVHLYLWIQHVFPTRTGKPV